MEADLAQSNLPDKLITAHGRKIERRLHRAESMNETRNSAFRWSRAGNSGRSSAAKKASRISPRRTEAASTRRDAATRRWEDAENAYRASKRATAEKIEHVRGEIRRIAGIHQRTKVSAAGGGAMQDRARRFPDLRQGRDTGRRRRPAPTLRRTTQRTSLQLSTETIDVQQNGGDGPGRQTEGHRRTSTGYPDPVCRLARAANASKTQTEMQAEDRKIVRKTKPERRAEQPRDQHDAGLSNHPRRSPRYGNS